MPRGRFAAGDCLVEYDYNGRTFVGAQMVRDYARWPHRPTGDGFTKGLPCRRERAVTLVTYDHSIAAATLAKGYRDAELLGQAIPKCAVSERVNIVARPK